MTTRDHDVDGARLADELAAEFGREERTRVSMPPPPAAGDAPRSARTRWVILAVCLGIVAVQIPSLRAALGPRPSLHAGVDVSDEGAEACITKLWQISALVQQGESADAIARLAIAEPATHAPYHVGRDEHGVVVACPNPAAHGLTQLRITQTRPMPEASR